MTAKLTKNERTAIFAGTFNPFTAGHADIVARGLVIFDRIIVAVGVNASKACHNGSAAVIARLYQDEPRVEVEEYSGLTVDFARSRGVNVLLRGIRSVKDLEYERDMADINRSLTGIETVFLISRPELAAVSGSIVRELEAYGADVSAFLPNINR